MINLKVERQLLSVTLSNEIFDLDEIIKRRTKGENIEPWVTDLIKRRDELITIKNGVDKSVHKHVTIQVEDTIVF